MKTTNHKKSNARTPTAKREPWNLEPQRKIKPHRPGTKRSKLVNMLTDGATMARVMKTNGWDFKTACDGVRLLNARLGYGIIEKNGVLRLIKPK